MTAATPGRASRSRSVTTSILATAALTSIVLGGLTLAAPVTVRPGTTEQADGAVVGVSGLAYWSWTSTQLWGVPSPVPARASSVVSAPTVLPHAAAAFSINAATAGHHAVRWTFSELATAPASTEFELRFLDGLARGAVAVTVYLETQAATPRGLFAFQLYWDAGAFPPGSVTIETMQVTVLACSAVGVCP